MVGDDKLKIENLKKVQELVVNLSPNLLDNFMDEILAFQRDKTSEVRKTIVGLIEDVSKKEPDMLPRVIPGLMALLTDESAPVLKRAVQAASQVYRSTLIWISKAKSVTDAHEKAWQQMGQLRNNISDMVDHDNDG